MKRIFIFMMLALSVTMLVACGKKGPAQIEGVRAVNVRLGDPDFNPMDGITATDEIKGDVTSKVTMEGTVDVNTAGTYTVAYSVKASNGETASLTRVFTVEAIRFLGVGDRKISKGATAFNPLTGVSIIDPVDGTLRHQDNANPNVEVEIDYFVGEDDADKVDTQTLGDYTVVYTLTYKKVTVTATRIVSVVDEIVFEGDSDKEVELGLTFAPLLGMTAQEPTEEGTRWLNRFIVVWSSDFNKDLPGVYSIVYRILDPAQFTEEELEVINNEEIENWPYDPLNPSEDLEYIVQDGNILETDRQITVFNNIQLIFDGPASVVRGGTFDPMADLRARESLGALPPENVMLLEGVVDTSTVGEYTLKYKVTASFDTEKEFTRVINVTPPVQGKQDIYFMAGDLREVNPFHPDFTGQHQTERQQLLRAAEEKHNVKVHFVDYPPNAAWGPSRVQAMVQASTGGKALADVYFHISSDWLPALVNGGAVAPVDEFLAAGQIGENIHSTIKQSSRFGGKTYGFAAGKMNIEAGFYYNADLVSRLGVDNPTQMYLDGNWTWSSFEAWANEAKAQLAADEYVLGGALAYYAENLVPLNGGELINEAQGRIDFDRPAALETYEFINKLYVAGMFEPDGSRTYDQGSNEWRTGKVLFHPGQFWFLGADNRWGVSKDGVPLLNFELGFVPWPMSDSYKGAYRSPIYGPSFPVMASGMTQQRKELVFNVWYDMQRWISEEQSLEEFTFILEQRLEKPIYVDAYLTVYDKAYKSILETLMSGYATGSFKGEINAGIRDNSFKTRLGQIKGIYKDLLDQYLAAE